MGGKNRLVEIIARGVCIDRGRVLLCHTKGAPNMYLPGGHVEFGEASSESLRREIREELGRDSRVGRFLGVVEHTYLRQAVRCCEINLVHEVFISRLTSKIEPVSCEDYIEFMWVPVGSLGERRLEPSPLIPVIREFAGRGRNRRSCTWSSTYSH